MGVICEICQVERNKRNAVRTKYQENISSINHFDCRSDNNSDYNPNENILKPKDLSIRESKDITSKNDDNSNFVSTKIESKHDKIIQTFANLDEYKNKNQIQDTFFESTEERDDSVYNELKKLEKEQLKREFEKNIENFKKKSVNNDLIQNIIEMQDAKYIFRNKIIENINSNSKYN